MKRELITIEGNFQSGDSVRVTGFLLHQADYTSHILYHFWCPQKRVIVKFSVTEHTVDNSTMISDIETFSLNQLNRLTGFRQNVLDALCDLINETKQNASVIYE